MAGGLDLGEVVAEVVLDVDGARFNGIPGAAGRGVPNGAVLGKGQDKLLGLHVSRLARVRLHVEATRLAVEHGAVVHDDDGRLLEGGGNVKLDAIDFLLVFASLVALLLADDLAGLKVPNVLLVEPFRRGPAVAVAEEAAVVAEIVARNAALARAAAEQSVARLEAVQAGRAVECAALVAGHAKEARQVARAAALGLAKAARIAAVGALAARAVAVARRARARRALDATLAALGEERRRRRRRRGKGREFTKSSVWGLQR